ncbi:MAG: hypothetical protein LBP22_10060 [Deltaproteobacteria bacterium]|jgi:hypothetical protein|nr:hypothetical protein [Deltaproteobacteria bacterium]
MTKLANLAAYGQSCLDWARENLDSYQSPMAVEAALASVNAYPNLNNLKAPQSLMVLEERPDRGRLLALGREAVLSGRIFWEHTAAGEGTRLGLGPKFFVKSSELSGEPRPKQENLPLGLRHLIQLVFEIYRLSEESGQDPVRVLRRQKMLIIASQDSINETVRLTLKTFSPLIPPENFLFLAQASFYGLNRQPGGDWYFDQNSPRRLHNHGAMAIQKIMDEQVFRQIAIGGQEDSFQYLRDWEFFKLLEESWDLVSYNIEDLDYLTRALDFETLGLAVACGQAGCGMVMEILGNNPERPIKGGMCAYDEVLGRDVMIESFRLKDIQPRDIRYLNKNFNHYPNPALVLGRLKEEGLFLPAVVHDQRLYFQPVQGDLNFLVATVFFTRQNAKSINSLKSKADVPSALAAMYAQDRQPGFLGLMDVFG